MILLAERLQLRSDLSAQDKRRLVEFLNDKEANKYSEQRHVSHTQQSQSDYIDSIGWPHLYLGIYRGSTLVGSITTHIDLYNKISDIGIMVGRSYWGRGFGSEAWNCMVDHCFASGLRKIEAGCVAENNSMKRIFQKAGMEKEGERKNHFLIDNRPIHMELWARFNQ